MGEQQVKNFFSAGRATTDRLTYGSDEFLEDGMWSGRRAFIIGGGPSITPAVMSCLRFEPNVIGINMAYRFPETVFALCCSIGLLRRLQRERDWLDYLELKLTLEVCVWGTPSDHGCEVIRTADQDVAWSESLADGIPIARNCGPIAINLAALLGADPIYLLGFDMKGRNGITANYHNYYKRRLPDSRYELYAADIERRCAGRANIVNLTPDSALTCFPTQTLESVLP